MDLTHVTAGQLAAVAAASSGGGGGGSGSARSYVFVSATTEIRLAVCVRASISSYFLYEYVGIHK